ncbi:MAG: hypothetical protein MHM6MM_004380 [Cercozoa sp. M6MM]
MMPSNMPTREWLDWMERHPEMEQVRQDTESPPRVPNIPAHPTQQPLPSEVLRLTRMLAGTQVPSRTLPTRSRPLPASLRVRPHVSLTASTDMTAPPTLQAPIAPPKKKKKFLCTLCDKSFARRTNLRRHLMTHVKYRPWVCGHCDLRFTERTNARRHLQKQHNIEEPTLTDLPFDETLEDPTFELLKCMYDFL